jgi:hypothetical protein
MTEVPLTKSERSHQENIRRRNEKRKRSQRKQASTIERDEKLHAISNHYLPKIQELQIKMKAEQQKVWAEWRNSRSSAE